MRILTIRDIALKAGVGVSTVSRVLNNRPDVHPSTRQKVLDVVGACNYIQNSNAKNLKQRATGAVSIIVRGRDNTFLYHLAEKMLQYGRSSSHPFLIDYIGEKDDELEAARQLYAEKKVEGIIFLGANPIGREKELAQMKLPLVFATVDASALSVKAMSSVSVDNRRAAKSAVDYLFARGHRQIAVFGGKREIPDSIGQRYLGVLDSFTANGFSFDERLYAEAGFSMKSAYRAASALIEKAVYFTAVFAMSDVMAIGIMKALTDHGKRIPQDVSVIGFDGIELGHYYNPTLATIRQPSDEIARQSIDLILNSLEDDESARHILLDTELQEGASVRSVVDMPVEAC